MSAPELLCRSNSAFQSRRVTGQDGDAGTHLPAGVLKAKQLISYEHSFPPNLAARRPSAVSPRARWTPH